MGLWFNRAGASEEMEVACGQCLGCRLDRSRDWALRIVHESSLHECDGGNCFITLTYRDKIECNSDQLAKGQHVPSDWSLHKTHFQKFMKRLRKVYAPQKVRFYMCGEYGATCQHGINLSLVKCPFCNVGRPHYHACLFNCDFPDLESYATSHDGELRYTSPLLEKIWGYGFVDVGELNFDSAAYVARYIMKKVNGLAADDHYLQYNEDGEPVYVEPEFTLMSRKPGIGYEWFQKYESDCFPSDECPDLVDKVFKKVPRYYEEIFKCKDPLTLEDIKAVRQEFRRVHGDEYTPDRLMSKYKVHKAQVDLLQRKI
jgi:hypothetical protein